jgi:hypothetical protein
MSMNLRHAAAIALVGWYLMMPPITSFDLHAPLSEWETIGRYDSANVCSKWQRYERRLAQNYLARNPDHPVATPFANGQCVASDDPRLKGN